MSVSYVMTVLYAEMLNVLLAPNTMDCGQVIVRHRMHASNRPSGYL